MPVDPTQDPRPDRPGSVFPPRLGPYESEYDVRRGYEAGEAPAGAAARPAAREPVWIGRRRER